MSVPAAYLVVLMVWSTTPLTIAWSTEGMHPTQSATLRLILSVVLGWLVLRFMGLRLPWHRTALRHYAYGSLNVFGSMFCSYLALRTVPSGLLSVIYGLTPMLAGLLGQRLLGERSFGPHQWLSFVLALGGLGYIFLDDAVLTGEILPGMLLILLGVALFATSGVLVKRENSDLHPLSVAVGTMALSLPMYALTWLLMDPTWPEIDLASRAVWSILYLATFGSLIGFGCYFFVLQRLSASTVALVNLMTPVMALVLGSWLNGEQITPAIALGSGLILAGLGLYFWGDALIPGRRREA